ncbi:MAG: 1,4-alpha-glucan branching protein GlgB [Alphaproteobacteria bacterium]|nr:1,4-alpha-glucan branching protein GlgB [Alphaproteobacteria bacterium]
MVSKSGARERWQAAPKEIAGIVAGGHADPFSVLGLHQKGDFWVARAYVAGATQIEVLSLDGAPLGTLKARGTDGFFEGKIGVSGRAPIQFEVHTPDASWTMIDPFSFGPVLGPLDDYYIGEGSHLKLYERFGAHPMEFEGVPGTHFALWAPNATRVSVVGDFNGWDGRVHPMRKRAPAGVWEIFLPGVGPGAVYKFELIGPLGEKLPLKADPFARQAELRPKTGSVVADPAPFVWSDGDYMQARAQRDPRRSPMSTYEVHLGSWRRHPDGGALSYDELGEQLVPYVRDMGFTHIELLPITEHPYDPSWGYQPIGMFAPTARFGDPAGFARFVDTAHGQGIGVILDWVPAHFPTDEHGLAWFDGTALYEHADPKRGFHPDWNTAIYNFGRREVAAYLINNALYWLDRFHLDGLRVDAVASMLYLDYSRQPGEWDANERGGNENLEAVSFIKRVNSETYAAHKGSFTIAEESTAWPGVSHPVSSGGLGFGFKWNLGFMHDTLSYMGREPIHRRYHHNDLTFGLLYAFSENFVLPLSHDEVVHGKGSLLSKMSGDDWGQFANLRAYYGFMWGYPGKKLLFMGQEFAQRAEWNDNGALDWELLDAPAHEGVRRLVADLNGAYGSIPALYGRDCEPEGFEWLIANDHENSVFAFLRRAGEAAPVVVIANFTPTVRTGYVVPVPLAGCWRERINTDAQIYGGTNCGNLGMGTIVAKKGNYEGRPAAITLTLPPLATLILEFEGP